MRSTRRRDQQPVPKLRTAQQKAEFSKVKGKQRRHGQKYKSTSLRPDIYSDDDDSYSVFEDLVIEMSEAETHETPGYYHPSPMSDLDESCSASSSSGFGGSNVDDDTISDVSFEGLPGGDSTNDDSVFFGFLNTLTMPGVPELFANGTLSCRHGPSGAVAAVNRRFLHPLGDVHTVFSALLDWLDKNDQQRQNKAWCKLNGVNSKAFRFLVQHARRHRAEYLSILGDRAKAYECLSNAIFDCYQSDLCIYMGHPQIGYRRLRDNTQLPCCPSSSVHPTSMPKFAICLPRHLHSDQQECHYIIPIKDDRAHQITTRLFPDFDEEAVTTEKVVMLPDISTTLGKTQCDMLLRYWNQQKVNCYVDTSDNRDIKVYAPISQHEYARQLLSDNIQLVKDKTSTMQKVFKYPPKIASLGLTISDGATCEFVECAKDGALFVEDSWVYVRSHVTIELSVCEDCDPNYVQDILRDCNPSNFVVRSEKCPVTVVTTNFITSKRVLTRLEEDKNVEILNSATVSAQLRTCELVVHSGVFPVIGEAIQNSLKSLKDSPKFNLTYSFSEEMRQDASEMKVFTMSTSASNVYELEQKLNNVIDLNRTVFQLHPRMSREVTSACALSLISNRTGALLHRPDLSGEVHVFGTPQARKEAMDLLNHVKKTPNLKWTRLGKCSVEGVDLPADFPALLNKRKLTIELDSKGKSTKGFVFVDVQQKELWALATPDQLDASREFTIHELVKAVHELYGFEVQPSQITFDSATVVEDCVVCYAPIDGRPYVVEACGHLYCRDCLQTQVKSALSENRVPLKCAECETPFTVADVEHTMSLLGSLKEHRLLKCSLSHYITSHHDEYRFCPWPNCEGIFRLQGNKCLVCSKNVCAKCLNCYHGDMSCDDYKGFGQWQCEDPKKRKFCPKCGVGIEKTDGCNCVTCSLCKRSICWVCRAVFDNSTECYKHIDVARHWRH